MSSTGLLTLFTLAILACCHAAEEEREIFSLKENGTDVQYKGLVYTSEFNHTTFLLAKFLGIPYAQPPVEGRRFAKPEPWVNEDNTTIDATQFKSICYQKVDPTNDCQRGWNMSEDCLYLNIYVPLKQGDVANINTDLESRISGKYPVYVFIHGGAFFRGNGNCYIPSNLAGLGEIIVVNFNYRLGPLGFLTTDDDVLPGNLGLWDQHEAIKWIHGNIHLFGGDPSRITVGGQSAGSQSAIYQSLFAPNRDLFQRVIAQSGTPMSRQSVSTTGYEIALNFSNTLGCNIDSASKHSDGIKTCLMKADAYTMAQTLVPSIITSGVPFQPTLDGKFVNKAMYSFLAQPSGISNTTIPDLTFPNKDLLIGYVAEDGEVFYRLWTILLNDKITNDTTRSEAMNSLIDVKKLRWIIFVALADKFNEDINQYDPLIDVVIDRYIDWQTPEDLVSMSNRAVKLLTEVFFALPTIGTALRHTLSQEGKPIGSTYMYKFRLPSTNKGFKETALSWFEGTEHTADIPYVFGWVNESESVDISLAMMTYFSNFIKSGNPNSPKATRPPTWEQYNLTNQTFLEISSTSTLKHYDVADSRHFWEKLMPALRVHFKNMYEADVKDSQLQCEAHKNAGKRHESNLSFAFHLLMISLCMKVTLW
ncbi:cholinesterase 1-like [Physella acuta]|uniref:cholinesterase 1-like n=1 Tax=Physella acuta TaxID=109671 RepID=UPI0027DEA002|nr:cholinesterase 1-like [Physella acuta]